MIHSSDSSAYPDPQLDDPILDLLLTVDEQDSAAYQEVAAALAYGAPVVPLNPNLKHRLFETLGLDEPEPDIMALLNLSIQDLKAKAESLTWDAMEMARGFEIAILQEQRSSRTMACFIRAEGPGVFPNHYHPRDEVLLVLDGDIVEDDRVYGAGDRLEAAGGSSHRLNTTQGCLLFCITSMDNQFTDVS